MPVSSEAGDGLLARATATVPALRYALALGVLAAGVALAAGSLDLRITVFGILILFLMMVLLVIISQLAKERGSSLQIAMSIIVYFSITMLIVVIVLFTLTFFVRPDTLREHFYLNSFYQLVGLQPTEAVLKRNASRFIAEFDDAVSGAATPTMMAAAIERTTAFWRQPEQREILRKYRCGDPSSTIIFDKSAEYVFGNNALMKDVDTMTRYYDAVARCVLRGECDTGQVCAYFGSQMDDFQRQYTTYFHEIRILEGRDPASNIRQMLFKVCPKQTAPPASHGDMKC
jgi:hypothetical protein